jgi:hypothetical protein
MSMCRSELNSMIRIASRSLGEPTGGRRRALASIANGHQAEGRRLAGQRHARSQSAVATGGGLSEQACRTARALRADVIGQGDPEACGSARNCLRPSAYRRAPSPFVSMIASPCLVGWSVPTFLRLRVGAAIICDERPLAPNCLSAHHRNSRCLLAPWSKGRQANRRAAHHGSLPPPRLGAVIRPN